MNNQSLKIENKPNQDFWNESLEKYRIAKTIRKLKKHGYTFKRLGELLEIDRHYVYNLMRMNLKPPDGILEKLEQLND
jgi:hypothetical protein